ncbi:hypothetical protein B0H16DRAFT_1715631 [Mycena metata]|uniref:Uncharacterized protein n=1 Tax=Mycena metata TaxID=1033252 RepID=A0AAD7JUU4_9AGAR|nr:hypothetical protein B0H16DRAFT_1715631 [Mycena metata]
MSAFRAPSEPAYEYDDSKCVCAICDRCAYCDAAAAASAPAPAVPAVPTSPAPTPCANCVDSENSMIREALFTECTIAPGPHEADVDAIDHYSRPLIEDTGVRWSEFCRLPYWDPTRMPVIDAMHCVLEGVTIHPNPIAPAEQPAPTHSTSTPSATLSSDDSTTKLRYNRT